MSANVTIEVNAKVKNSILLPNSTIEEGVKLKKVIIDADVRVTKKKEERLNKMRNKNKDGIFIIGKHKAQDSVEVEK